MINYGSIWTDSLTVVLGLQALVEPSGVSEQAPMVPPQKDAPAPNSANGVMSTFAGTGEPGYSGDGGPALEATWGGEHSAILTLPVTAANAA